MNYFRKWVTLNENKFNSQSRFYFFRVLKKLDLTKMLIFMLILKKSAFYSMSLLKIPEKSEFLYIYLLKCCLLSENILYK